MKVIDEMMKISQSEEKIIKQVDEIKNIRVDPSLYNFDIFYQLSSPTQLYDNRYVDENGVQRMLEEVLSIAATEAVCERYFRICSTIVKKPYITNMNAEIVSNMAFIRYYKIPLCKLINKKDMFSNLSSLFNCCVCWHLGKGEKWRMKLEMIDVEYILYIVILVDINICLNKETQLFL